jgi:hypothetical protein
VNGSHRPPLQNHVTEEALLSVPETVTSMMVFGSFARGDASTTSDIDVLALSMQRSLPKRIGRVNISFYDEGTLRSMAKRGDLFVLHLRNEGKILRDVEGRLQACLTSYLAPPNYDGVRVMLREVANLLDASDSDYRNRWKQYNDLVIYLLRTALYVQFAELGEPVFSLPVIVERIGRPELRLALKLKAALNPDFATFKVARELVEEFLRTDVHNPFGTIEALITNAATYNTYMLPFGLRLLGSDKTVLAYDPWLMAS